MTKRQILAMMVPSLLAMILVSMDLRAQGSPSQKTFDKVCIEYKDKHFYTRKTYPKEDIRSDEYGRYVIGPDNIKYYLNENDYRYRKSVKIVCVEGVKLDNLSQKLDSIDYIDRVRVLIDKGMFCEYQCFTKNEIQQDDNGYYVRLAERGKFYLDKAKLNCFKEPSPNAYLYINAVLSGEVIARKIEEARIFFPLNSTEIDETGVFLLEQVARRIKSNRQFKRLVIIGHTCSLGSVSYNKVLSYRRAKKVMQVLVNKYKVDPSLCDLKGRGEDLPIASNDVESGRQKNRRVEFKVLIVR